MNIISILFGLILLLCLARCIYTAINFLRVSDECYDLVVAGGTNMTYHELIKDCKYETLDELKSGFEVMCVLCVPTFGFMLLDKLTIFGY